MKISIVETEQEYLLTIPPSEKERAKSIDGRRWDSERKVWVFPKNEETRKSLLAEFGNIFNRLPYAGPPSRTSEEDVRQSLEKEIRQSLEGENLELRNQIRELRDSVSNLRKEPNPSSAEQTYRQLYEKQKKELDLTKKERDALSINVEQIRLNLRKSKAEVEKLEEKHRTSLANNSFEIQIKRFIRQHSRVYDEFDRVLELKLDPSFPFELCNLLEKVVSEKLNAHSKSMNLFEMLTMARDKELLTEEALDLSHLIRKQRNLVAHGNIEESIRVLINPFLLSAAALLWPEFQ